MLQPLLATWAFLCWEGWVAEVWGHTDWEMTPGHNSVGS